MIALYLLSAHLVGDFVLQTRWQAACKLTRARVRAFHILGYLIPFLPIAFVYGRPDAFHGGRWTAGALFLAVLGALHFATDSRRFRATLGDVLSWQLRRLRSADYAVTTWLDYLYGPSAAGLEPLAWRLARNQEIDEGRVRFPPPNPWGSTPILVEQTLHVCQLALLGGLLLHG